jgi:hypothetical protein
LAGIKALTWRYRKVTGLAQFPSGQSAKNGSAPYSDITATPREFFDQTPIIQVIGDEATAVEAVQALARTEPKESSRVAPDPSNAVVRQTFVFGIGPNWELFGE